MNDTDPKNAAATDDRKADSGTDWGEDWESAFQAEDELFFPDLDEPSSSSAPPAPEEPSPPPAPQETNKPPPQKPPAEKTAPTGSLFGLRWLLAGLGGGLILMLLFLGIYLLLTDAPEQVTIKQPLRKTPTRISTTAQPESVAVPLPRSVKIGLKPFLIPVKSEKGKPLREFLDLKLTLIIQRDSDQNNNLTPEQIILLRDSIYRFFLAIPAADLHHYALARGEMLKKTTRAISRDLHNLTIKSIIFEKYRLT